MSLERCGNRRKTLLMHSCALSALTACLIIVRHNPRLTDPAFAGSVSPYHHALSPIRPSADTPYHHALSLIRTMLLHRCDGLDFPPIITLGYRCHKQFIPISHQASDRGT